MPHLFEPFEQRGVTCRNRVVVSSMCQYSSEDGFANDWHLVHLVSRAVGGAGAIVFEVIGGLGLGLGFGLGLGDAGTGAGVNRLPSSITGVVAVGVVDVMTGFSTGGFVC